MDTYRGKLNSELTRITILEILTKILKNLEDLRIARSLVKYLSSFYIYLEYRARP